MNIPSTVGKELELAYLESLILSRGESGGQY